MCSSDLAAEIIGGSRPETDLELDLEAAIERVELAHAERSVILHFAAGGGISGEEAFVQEGASARGELRVFAKEEVDPEESRQLLVG